MVCLSSSRCSARHDVCAFFILLLFFFLQLLSTRTDATPTHHHGAISSTAARKFLPNTPNGLLRSITALNHRRPGSKQQPSSPDEQPTQEVTVKTIKTPTAEEKETKRRKKLITIPRRPTNEQIQKELDRVGFYYGFTPQVVTKSTTEKPKSNRQPRIKKKSKKPSTRKKRVGGVRETMSETLDEIKSMRLEMEALRRELRTMKQRLLGEEVDDEGERERAALLARTKRIREFERISEEVEKWAEHLLFRQDGEVDGWTQIECNKVIRKHINSDGRTRAYLKWMKDSRGRKAAKDDNREYPCLKVYATVDAPLEEVCVYLSQEKRLPDYNALIDLHKDLEEITPSAKICAVKTPQILFIKPKTMVTFCSHRWLRDGTQVVLNQACDYDGTEADAFALRGATFIGRDPDDPEKTRISMLTHASPGDDVPNWACRTAVTALAPIEPFKLFYHINEGVQKCRPELAPDPHDTELVGMPGRISRPAGFGFLGWAAFWPNGGGTKEGFNNSSTMTSTGETSPESSTSSSSSSSGSRFRIGGSMEENEH